jgi:hypothetical protein
VGGVVVIAVGREAACAWLVDENVEVPVSLRLRPWSSSVALWMQAARRAADAAGHEQPTRRGLIVLAPESDISYEAAADAARCADFECFAILTGREWFAAFVDGAPTVRALARAGAHACRWAWTSVETGGSPPSDEDGDIPVPALLALGRPRPLPVARGEEPRSEIGAGEGDRDFAGYKVTLPGLVRQIMAVLRVVRPLPEFLVIAAEKLIRVAEDPRSRPSALMAAQRVFRDAVQAFIDDDDDPPPALAGALRPPDDPGPEPRASRARVRSTG